MKLFYRSATKKLMFLRMKIKPKTTNSATFYLILMTVVSPSN